MSANVLEQLAQINQTIFDNLKHMCNDSFKLKTDPYLVPQDQRLVQFFGGKSPEAQWNWVSFLFLWFIFTIVITASLVLQGILFFFVTNRDWKLEMAECTVRWALISTEDPETRESDRKMLLATIQRIDFTRSDEKYRKARVKQEQET